ncbi:MAG TPA: APC family permease [Verrucomicrobiae bacterium]|nr:APC family permease [Verrucomicrobiae bacterium]
MTVKELLFGRPLRTREEQVECLGVASAVPVLGLDALASAAYGPEAALSVLLPLGALASGYIGPISFAIICVLFAVAASYLQTIPAYPNGGGSFTVAKENLGRAPGLLAASALSIDYVLNVAVAISTGVGALVSMCPRLLPWTLPLCLAILVLLTIVNLRGVRSAGLVFMLPTYLFVGCLLTTIGIGIFRIIMGAGHPVAVAPLPKMPVTQHSAGIWLVMRAFASGCTALTGVEAVSNAVPIFREPKIRHARRTLIVILLVLALLLAGIAVLARFYNISATVQGKPGYQSVLSQLAGAVEGRGPFYYVTMGSVLIVLCLSANTSFADFPRVCRMLAQDEYLPSQFAHRGRRLVYSQGILLLALFSGVLLILFGGITDRLIPLFAVGAFMAFSLSQFGMVVHWWRHREGPSRQSLVLNACGGIATTATLGIIIVSKFTEGAWLTLVTIPALIFFYYRVRRYHERLGKDTGLPGESKLDLGGVQDVLIIIPMKRLDRVAQKALRLAMGMSGEIIALQILAEEMKTEDLTACWQQAVEAPAREMGMQPPRLVVLRSPYREFYGPLLQFVRRTAGEHPQRPIAVMIPEVVEKKWYQFFVRHRSTFLKGLLLLEGGPQTVIITAPFYVHSQDVHPTPSTAAHKAFEHAPRIPAYPEGLRSAIKAHVQRMSARRKLESGPSNP